MVIMNHAGSLMTKDFRLRHGSDEEYLRFICEVFHPAVCKEGELSKKYFDEINSLLRNDRYELYACKKISGKKCSIIGGHYQKKEVLQWLVSFPFLKGRISNQ
jgi:hypothetical protein